MDSRIERRSMCEIRNVDVHMSTFLSGVHISTAPACQGRGLSSCRHWLTSARWRRDRVRHGTGPDLCWRPSGGHPRSSHGRRSCWLDLSQAVTHILLRRLLLISDQLTPVACGRGSDIYDPGKDGHPGPTCTDQGRAPSIRRLDRPGGVLVIDRRSAFGARPPGSSRSASSGPRGR